MTFLLNNIPKNHFNKMILNNRYTDFFIINENSRKILANLFDCIGNIASYNDYYAFYKKFENFGEFKKCHCSKEFKQKLNDGEGIVIFIDFDNLEIKTPCSKMQQWFNDNYSKKFNIPIENFYNDTNNISYNNLPFDYENYKHNLIHNTDFYNVEYPLSTDEMDRMAIYNEDIMKTLYSNEDTMKELYNINSKFILRFEPNDYLIQSYDSESYYSDDSDDIQIYLKNKELVESVVELQESVVELQESVVEEQRTNELAKELFEKHNQKINQSVQEQPGYSSKFWGLFGWK